MPANNILDEQEVNNNDDNINNLIATSTPFDYAMDLTQWKPNNYNGNDADSEQTHPTISPDDNDTITDDENDYENDYKHEYNPYEYVYSDDVTELSEIFEKEFFRGWKKQGIKYTFCRNEYKFPPWPQGTFPQFQDFLATDFNSAMKHEKVREAFGERVQFSYNGNLENDNCDIGDILDSGKKKKPKRDRKKYHSSSKRSSKHYKSSSSSSKYKKSSSSSRKPSSSSSSSSSSRITPKTSSSHSKSISNKHKTTSSSSGSKRVDVKIKSNSKQRISSSSSSKKLRTESKPKSTSKSNGNSKSKVSGSASRSSSGSRSRSKSKSKLRIKAIPSIKDKMVAIHNNALNGTAMNHNNNGYGYNYNYFPNLNHMNININMTMNMNMNDNGYGGYYDHYGNFVPCDPYNNNNQTAYEYHQYYQQQQQQCFNNNNNHYQQFYPNQDIVDPMTYFPMGTTNKLADIAENTNDSSSVPHSHLSYSNSRNEALNL